MPYCNAFDHNHNPCLTEITAGNDVCLEHVNFYTDQWFLRYAFRLHPIPVRFYFASPEKVKKVYIKAILESRIKITQQHFRDLEGSRIPLHNLVDYYLLCCMQANVDPLWSMNLFHASIQKIVYIHTQIVDDTDLRYVSLLSDYLNPIFNTNTRSFTSMFYHTFYSMARLGELNNINIDNPKASILQYIISHPKFIKEFIWEYSCLEEHIISLLSSKSILPPLAGSIKNKLISFLNYLPELRLRERLRHKLAFQPLAKEILEVSWEPERFVNWCLNISQKRRYEEIYSKWGR